VVSKKLSRVLFGPITWIAILVIFSGCREADYLYPEIPNGEHGRLWGMDVQKTSHSKASLG